jgi:hypothetical protein
LWTGTFLHCTSLKFTFKVSDLTITKKKFEPLPASHFFIYLLAATLPTTGYSFRHMLIHLWLLTVRILIRLTHAATRDFCLHGLRQRLGPYIPQQDSNLRHNYKDHQILMPPVFPLRHICKVSSIYNLFRDIYSISISRQVFIVHVFDIQ